VKFKYITEGIKKGSLVLPPVADGVGNNPDLFKQALTYGSVDTRTGGTPQYNGNISTTTWQVAGRAKQTYAFTYDDLDRLLNAKYMDVTDTYNGSNGQWNSTYGAENKFEEKQTYDLRGNIMSIERNGLNSGTWTNGKEGFTAATYGKIDNLQFQYYYGNKLVRVQENSLPDRGFRTTISPSNGGWQYGYDANGNLRFDFNKGITAIWYNHLNLPTLVYFSNGRSITFNYTADGELLRKNTWNPVDNTGYWMEYVNGIEYKNQILNRLPHPEGSVVLNTAGSGYELEYTLKDHLGNNRVVFRDKDNDRIIDTSDIKQINHTYPFGMDMEGNWNGSFMGSGTQGNAYKYNGKEFNNWYHYGARFYDPAIGRWHALDPKPNSSISLYAAFQNNPLYYTDPHGDTVRVYTETSGAGGHAWLSVGEGENMTMYTFGRYAGTNDEWHGINILSNGPGVLVKLSGAEASEYNQKKFDKTGATVFQILDITDEAVQEQMDAKFYSSTKLPEKGEYKGDSRAHIVGDYKLLSNNCTTVVCDALNDAGSEATERMANKAGIQKNERFVLPASLQDFLKWQANSFLGNGTTKVQSTIEKK
jgi:RHS repeat-associated protein